MTTNVMEEEGTFQCFNQDDVFTPLAFSARKKYLKERCYTRGHGNMCVKESEL